MSDKAMSTLPNERLVEELIAAAVHAMHLLLDGHEDTPEYKHAVGLTEFLRKHVLLRLKATCGLACHLDKAMLPTEEKRDG